MCWISKLPFLFAELFVTLIFVSCGTSGSNISICSKSDHTLLLYLTKVDAHCALSIARLSWMVL